MADNVFDELFLKVPHAWEPDEAERAKQEFRHRRPAVPRHVVRGLWQYWRQRQPERPLFADPDQDLALLLHAQAFGLDIGVPDATDPLAALLARARESADCAPLTPPPLTWGPRAALATQVRAALPSTLVRAWVVADEQGPIEVLVVGAGLPEIRQDVVQAALMTSLRINGLVDTGAGEMIGDVVGVGVARVSAGLAGRGSAIELPSVFDARRVTVAEGAASTARGALRDLVNGLRALERETNLVEVAEVRYADLAGFADTVRAMADRAADEPYHALLRPASTEAGEGGLVALLPCLRTAHADEGAGAAVGLALHPDLLATEAYGRLEEAHQRVLTRRLILDAELRRDQIEADIRWLRSEHDDYAAATPEERRANWESVVLLVERFDERTGTKIKLAEPEEMNTDTYMLTHVPQLITVRQRWADRLNELVVNLRSAAGQPHAPARQLAAGRFLDAVLRDVTPDESPATELAFRRWAEGVAPMLRYEWRHELRRQRIAPEDVFTRHTAFLTRYLPPIGGDDAALFVGAYSIVDERRSAVLADAARGVLVVRDATDHAEPEAAGTADAPEAVAAADAAWDALARLAEDPGADEEAFTAAFLSTMRAHPRHTARRMVDTLQPPEPGAAEAEALAEEMRRAERAMSLSEGMDRARTAMRMSAFLTARQSLDNVRAEPHWEARAWLLRAIVECVAADLPGREVPGLLGSGMAGLPPAALRALDEAVGLDPGYTASWLAALPEVDLGRAIRRLFHGIPRIRAATSERERAAWLFRTAVESARLARQLEQAGEELAEEHEAIDAALVVLGRALEDVLVGAFVGGARNEAEQLLELLTGEEPPRYGGVTGA
ncbi:hypothetical protein [Micromonospora okii]|uniref:hypothetical protein n=1 Tax=Micromonospora okii TaxID=1182970 RepID=UPI001E504228|nr:hypothetical protein [Micromonospora okii]